MPFPPKSSSDSAKDNTSREKETIRYMGPKNQGSHGITDKRVMHHHTDHPVKTHLSKLMKGDVC